MSKGMTAVSLSLALVFAFGACAVEPSHEVDLAAPPPEDDFVILPPETDLAAPSPEDDVGAPEAAPEPVEPAPGADHPADSPLSRTDADTLFDASIIPVFELELPEDEWVWLQKNPTLEEYREAVLTYEGEIMGEVGLRFRGADGSLRMCVDEEGNLLRDLGCTKLGMKIKFDLYDEEMRFFGMKRLNFMSMTRDGTKMVENIAYGLFRDVGVPASRTGWAVLKVNGESFGLFSLIEQIDGRFTDDRWPGDGDGNLYKEVWPQSSSEAYYAGGLETNTETATHEQFAAFYLAMAAAAPAERLAVLDEWTDLDQLYNYMAVHDAISHWDGVTAVYCGWGGACPGPTHNYYWYQHETTNTFTLIPWDVDNTMRAWSSSTMEWNKFDGVPHWTESPDDCDTLYPAFTFEGTTLQVIAPGCLPFFQTLASDHDRYAEAIQNLIDGPFDVATLRDQIDEYADLIRDAVAEDPTLAGVLMWESEVHRLKRELEVLTRQLELYRDGIPLDPDALP